MVPKETSPRQGQKLSPHGDCHEFHRISTYGLPGHNAKLHPKSWLSEGRDPLPIAMKRTVTPYQTSRIEYQMLCKKSILIFILPCVTEVGWMINEADLRPALAGERQRLSFTALPLPQRSEASARRCVTMEAVPKRPANRWSRSQ
jgi:hypothetical protein